MSKSKMVQCDRDYAHTIQFDGSIILNIPKREVGSKVDSPALQNKILTLPKITWRACCLITDAGVVD